MDFYQFVSSIVSSVSWPAAILIITYSIRKQLPSLVARLREFTFPGGGAKFEHDVNAIEEIVIESKTNSAIKPSLEAAEKSDKSQDAEYTYNIDRINFIEFAGMYPKAAAFQAFKEIEVTYIEFFGADEKGSLGLTDTIRDLVANGFMSRNDEKIFGDLRRTRNQVIHDKYENLQLSDVLTYKALCERFAGTLRAVLNSKFRPPRE